MRRVIEYILTYLLRFAINVLNIFPIKPNRIVFYSFNGKQYSCNPRCISEYLNEKYSGKYEIIWAFKDIGKYENIIPKYVKTVKYRSLKYYYFAKTSHFMIYNVQGFGELSRRKNQVFIQTWHASNGYKKLRGLEGFDKKLGKLWHSDYSYVMSGAESMTKRRIRGNMSFKGEVLKGTPRMDILINRSAPELKDKVYEALKVDKDNHIVLYAPTWRADKNLSDYGLDYKQLKTSFEKRFGGKWTVAVRLHPNVKTRICSEEDYVVDATDYPDMSDLLYAVEAMISDYSSCIWDYSFCNKPCILFCGDIDVYRQKKSFDIPIEEWRFPIALNMDELVNIIENFNESDFSAAMERHHKEMGNLEDGHATERVANLIELLSSGR